jgi:flagellar biogenesis protein FliO
MVAQSSDTAPKQRAATRSRIIAFLRRICSLASVPRSERRLRLCETLSLGEKRFVAVVEYDRDKFLLAGTPENISLLQRLDVGPEKPDRGAMPEVKSAFGKFSQA